MKRKFFLVAIISLLVILWPTKDIAAQSQTIAVYPQRGRIGETFAVSGRGFSSFSSVSVQFAENWRNITADYYGGFQTSFSVPPIESGIYYIKADSGVYTVFSVYEVLPPIIAISPQLLMMGDKLTIWVYGAMPFDMARVYLGNNEITPSPISMVGRDGSVVIETIVPSLSPGNYNLKVKGARFEANLTVVLIPDSPGKVENVISPIKDKVVRIWGYYAGKWYLYDPAIPPELNTLKEFIPASGYFLQVKEDCDLAAVGNRSYKLYKGWNLIGW
ncbi:MAG: hypothetical protein HYT20_02600 [Candidatus Nealsonbacteria bacterium]|nr:hypothetical protein [Candidatus Nealsonbacteria bacterium]